jgi:hypothetical protein
LSETPRSWAVSSIVSRAAARRAANSVARMPGSPPVNPMSEASATSGVVSTGGACSHLPQTCRAKRLSIMSRKMHIAAGGCTLGPAGPMVLMLHVLGVRCGPTRGADQWETMQIAAMATYCGTLRIPVSYLLSALLLRPKRLAISLCVQPAPSRSRRNSGPVTSRGGYYYTVNDARRIMRMDGLYGWL